MQTYVYFSDLESQPMSSLKMSSQFKEMILNREIECIEAYVTYEVRSISNERIELCNYTDSNTGYYISSNTPTDGIAASIRIVSEGNAIIPEGGIFTLLSPQSNGMTSYFQGEASITFTRYKIGDNWYDF